MNSSDSERWLEAMRSEMNSMCNNQVWTLVDPPKRSKIYRVQMDFLNKFIILTMMIFLLVTMVKSLRILLATTSYYDYNFWQMGMSRQRSLPEALKRMCT